MESDSMLSVAEPRSSKSLYKEHIKSISAMNTE